MTPTLIEKIFLNPRLSGVLLAQLLNKFDKPARCFQSSREDESKDQRNARVAERIRHRARAINSWDYERLLLEEFPTIGKVACFPNCSYCQLLRLRGSFFSCNSKSISRRNGSIWYAEIKRGRSSRYV